MELLAHRRQAFESSFGDFDRKPFAGMTAVGSEIREILIPSSFRR